VSINYVDRLHTEVVYLPVCSHSSKH